VSLCKFSEAVVTNKLQAGYTHFDDYRKPFFFTSSVINITKEVLLILLQDMSLSLLIISWIKVIQITDNLNIVKGNHTIQQVFIRKIHV
jgi:hypothetical protein